jgi:hypothetical protein
MSQQFQAEGASYPAAWSAKLHFWQAIWRLPLPDVMPQSLSGQGAADFEIGGLLLPEAGDDQAAREPDFLAF